MKKMTSPVLIFGVTVAALMVLVLFLSPVCPVVPVVRSTRARARLLSQTDHRALLDAGREILSLAARGSVQPGILAGDGDTHLPDGSPIPQCILHLAPRRIRVSHDGYLMLEMHGGMDHFGVLIYPADFKEPFTGFKLGDRKLLDGLWYYDEEYQLNSNYDKIIDRLLTKKHGG